MSPIENDTYQEPDENGEEYEIREANRKMLEDILRETQEADVVKRNCRIISFVSRSNGRGRSHRLPREVTFFVYKSGGDRSLVFQVKHGEIFPQKWGLIRPDLVATEVLQNLPKDERTADKLLQIVQNKNK